MEDKGKRAKRKFTEEFKQEAIALGQKLGNSRAAKDLGINESQIRQWKKKLQGPSEGSSSKKSYAEHEQEIKKLSKEKGYLKEINDVLKKSTAIFSKDHLKGSK